MAITLSSFISSSIAITILIGLLFLILKKQTVMSRFGLGCIYLLVLLILLRGFIPVEFLSIRLTASIYLEFLFTLRTLFLTHLFYIGSLSVTPMILMYTAWFIGFFICLFRTVRRYIKSKKIIASLPDESDPETTRIFHSVRKTLYPEKDLCIRLVSSDIVSTPAIWGIKKSVILLPDIPYTSNELHYVFTHEILHYKHKDFLIKILVDILSAVHWWNPVISRLLFSVVNQIQELLVDYHLTNQLTPDQRSEYMLTLTKTLRYQKADSSVSGSYALADNHKNSAILQRVQYIIEHPVKQLSLVGSVLCVILFVLSFTFVFEPVANPTVDEDGNKVFYDDGKNTYYIKNGDAYDLYMQNEYVVTTDEILETFKDVPVYSSKEEVP